MSGVVDGKLDYNIGKECEVCETLPKNWQTCKKLCVYAKRTAFYFLYNETVRHLLKLWEFPNSLYILKSHMTRAHV